MGSIVLYFRHRLRSRALPLALLILVVCGMLWLYEQELKPGPIVFATFAAFLAAVPRRVGDYVLYRIWPIVVHTEERGNPLMDMITIAAQSSKLVADFQAARQADSLAATMQVIADAAGLIQTIALSLTNKSTLEKHD